MLVPHLIPINWPFVCVTSVGWHTHSKVLAPEREINVLLSFNVLLMAIIVPIGIKGAFLF